MQFLHNYSRRSEPKTIFQRVLRCKTKGPLSDRILTRRIARLICCGEFTLNLRTIRSRIRPICERWQRIAYINKNRISASRDERLRSNYENCIIGLIRGIKVTKERPHIPTGSNISILTRNFG